MTVMSDFVTSDAPDPLDGATAPPLSRRLNGCSNPHGDLDTDTMEAGARDGHADPSSFALTASPAPPWPVSRPSSPFKGGWYGSAEDR